jgi:hypothetical protein
VRHGDDSLTRFGGSSKDADCPTGKSLDGLSSPGTKNILLPKQLKSIL